MFHIVLYARAFQRRHSNNWDDLLVVSGEIGA